MYHMTMGLIPMTKWKLQKQLLFGLNAEEEKRLWVREWPLQRPTLGAYATLVQELSVEDPRSYMAFVRITYNNFMGILERVGPLIKKQDTVMRRAIPPGERLAVTLRYLGSGLLLALSISVFTSEINVNF